MAQTIQQSAGGSRAAFEVVDIVLCTVLAASCAYVTAGGFYVDAHVQSDPLLLVAFPAAMLVALVLSRRSGVALVVGWLAFACVAGLAVAWAVMTAGGESPLSDEEANATLFVLEVICCTLVVFLLSRSSIGLVGLAVAVVMDIALVEFLFRHDYLVASAIALGALVAVFAFSRMRITYERQGSTWNGGSGAFVGSAVLPAAAGALAVLVGLGLAVGLVTALNPPLGTLKLFTEERALEEIEVEGIADVEEVPDDELTSDLLDGRIDSSKLGDEDSAAGDEARSTPSPTAMLGSVFAATFDINTDSADFSPISHELVRHAWLIVLVIVVCILVGIIVGKRLSRRRWLGACSRLQPDEQVIALYRKMEKCLRLVGINRWEHETVAEYGARSEASLKPLFGPTKGLPDQNALFADLIGQFEQARYGGVPVSADVAESFSALYRTFPKRAVRYLGRLRYILRFMRI